jgi:hypothetical protein
MKGYLKEVTNEERELNSDMSYFQILVWNGEKWETLLLTDSELERIRERSEKNEDMSLAPSWMDKFCKMIGC